MDSSAKIKRNLKEKKYQLKDIREAFEHSNRKFQSTIWNNFEAILNEKSEPIPNFVCCKYCKDIFKCTVGLTKKNIGTSNLLKHDKNCPAKIENIQKNNNRMYIRFLN